MKITLITICSALAAVSVAQAVPAHRRHDNHPKYYFPRVVKRQVDSPFANSTISASASASVTGLDSVLSSAGSDISSIADVANGDTTTTANGDATATANADTTATVNADTTTTANAAATTLLPPAVSGSDPPSSDASSTTAFIVGVDTVITDAPISTNPPTATATTIDTAALGSASDVLSSASDAASSVLSVVSSLKDAVSTAASEDIASITSALSSAQSVASEVASEVSSAQEVISSGVAASPPVSLPADTGSASASPPIDTGSVTVSRPVDTGSVTISPPPIDTGSVSVSPPIDTRSFTVSPPIDTGTVSPPVDTGTVSPTIPPVSPTETPPPLTETPSLPTETPTVLPPLVNNNSTESIATPTPFIPTSQPETIKPTGTDTNTAFTPGSSIMSASPTKPASTAPSSSASAIPSELPRVITPEGGVPKAPDNSTLIQIGFQYGLNYEFVVKSSTAVSQIFTYLPMGVSNGLDIPKREMVMQYLQPYNTLRANGYITTLAMAYIPSEQLDQLSVDILNPVSDLYTKGDASVKTLMSMVDPTVPLLAGTQLDGNGTPINSAGGSAASPGDSQNGAPGADEGQSGGPVRPTSVGIAVGAVCGAAVYGVAMFLVARRYKKRRAAHQRSSSVMSGGQRRPDQTTNLMSGARNSYGSRFPQAGTGRGSRNSDRSDESGSGPSGRTYISPPVMAENSLGWN